MAGRKLGRHTNHRKAMWRNMAVSLLMHGQITTTLPKAKSVQPFVEKLLSVAKKNDIAARRRAMQMLGQDRVMVFSADDTDVPRNAYGEVARKGGRLQGPRIVQHLFETVAPRYADRNGGCTRVIKLARHRIGDGADLCVLQLISDEDTGPQVAGQFSRRRDKANRRMAFAAQLRKGGKAEAADGDEERKKGEAPEPADQPEQEGRSEPDSASEQHQKTDDAPEPREGDTAEGDDRKA